MSIAVSPTNHTRRPAGCRSAPSASCTGLGCRLVGGARRRRRRCRRNSGPAELLGLAAQHVAGLVADDAEIDPLARQRVAASSRRPGSGVSRSRWIALKRVEIDLARLLPAIAEQQRKRLAQAEPHALLGLVERPRLRDPSPRSVWLSASWIVGQLSTSVLSQSKMIARGPRVMRPAPSIVGVGVDRRARSFGASGPGLPSPTGVAVDPHDRQHDRRSCWSETPRAPLSPRRRVNGRSTSLQPLRAR